VYDPSLGKGGGWARYDLQLGAMLWFTPPSARPTPYAVYSAGGSTGRVLQLHYYEGSADGINAEGDTAVESWVYTRWFDEGNPALKKRWKRPIFVCDNSLDSVLLRVYAYRDYDFNGTPKIFDLDIVVPATGMLWGDNWGSGVWAGTITNTQQIEKGGNIGRGISVALKVQGPAAGDVGWGVNSVTWKYVPKRIR
jgi:hypothetical protein